MCQAIADGGRRCPRHQRSTLVAIRLATQEARNITSSMAAEIFNELRREGRHQDSIGNRTNEEVYTDFLTSLRASMVNSEVNIPDRYQHMLQEAAESEEVPDTATLYALTRLRATVSLRDESLTRGLQRLGSAYGYTYDQMRARFTEARNQITAQDERMTPYLHDQAFRQHLPTDTASVLAWNELQHQSGTDRIPAINMRELPEETRHIHHLHSVGYNPDTQQLAVSYAEAPETVSYYRNVPNSIGEDVMLLDEREDLSTDAPNGAHLVNLLRAMPDENRYANEEEAQEAATLNRCAACGQFISAVAEPRHECAQLAIARGVGAISREPDVAPVAIPADAEPIERERTAENQANPLPLRVRAVEETYPATTEDGRYTVHDAATRGRLMNRLNDFSEADQELIRNASRDTAFVFSATRSNTRGTATRRIVSSYDVREHAMENAPHYVLPGVDGVVRDAMLVRRGYVDMTSRNEAPDAPRINADVTLSASEPRPVLFADGTNDSTELSWASRADFREAYAQNPTATVTAPVEWSGALQGGVDEYGFDVSSTRFTVQGDLAVARAEDGTFAPASTTENLRCTCPLYRRHYHCSHVDYVHNHSVNVAQDMMLDEERTETARPSAAALAGLPAASFQIDGSGHAVANFARWSRNNEHSHYRDHNVGIGSLPTEEDIATDWRSAEARILVASASLTRTPPPDDLYRAYEAIGRVRFPIVADIPSLSSRERIRTVVRGTAEVYRNDNGQMVLDTQRLRCSCGRYTSPESPCEHLTAFAANVDYLVSDNDPERGSRTRHQREVDDARATIRAERNIRTRMETDGIDRDQAVADITREEEEEARMRAEEARLRREQEVRRNQERIQRTRDEFSQSEAGRAFAQYRETQRALWENSDAPTTVEETRAMLDASAEDRGARRDRRTFMADNVTDGVCDPNVPGSRRFGIELEFMLPDSNSYRESRDTLAAIARELNEEGLSESDRVRGYHAGQMENWQSWSLEEDATVSGELVSPLLDDSPQSWEQVQKVLDILQRHGATASVQAGSHVHVSTGSYGDSLATHIELVREMHRHEDILYRAAANPERGTHRGETWCAPNTDTSSSTISSAESSRWNPQELYRQSVHETALNMAAAGDGARSHAEFRLWDSSLDAATIQRQVAISVAMTETAERNVERNNGESHALADGERSHRGSFYSRDGREMSDEAVENLTRFLNSNFRRQEDREQFVLLMERNRFSS